MIQFNKEDLDQEELICFLHIPKTGGKTLWRLLDRQKDTFLVWHGKFFKQLNKPCTYFTMLRDPVDRVISTYYYIRRYERDPLHSQVKKMSLKEFVSYMNKEDLGNKPYPKKDLRSIRFRTVNLATRYISVGDPLNLGKAKENINNYFSVVGCTDMYDEFLFFMKNDLELTDLII
ncbi:sulfotransferase family 2 domain-containing protein [Halalkalibacter alkalisediminis]|uniref:Sulfotransferase family 2 domain-containing protein n=1 Tax=Halalkalibacter alkalisediminis TaxID=935616 RepID=A0ABV6NNW2_9BACI|nr:sulfotransferase family 2 domain-containing protein [Halalkalibacter alkalisediminis]